MYISFITHSMVIFGGYGHIRKFIWFHHSSHLTIDYCLPDDSKNKFPTIHRQQHSQLVEEIQHRHLISNIHCVHNLRRLVAHKTVESIQDSTTKSYWTNPIIESKMVLSSLGVNKQWVWFLFPIAGFMVGSFLDNKETERMVMFRDKSALYGRTLKEGEKPSWP